MEMLIFALLSLPLIALATNLRRRHPPGPDHLIPNCLLTRVPVLFLTGRKSPFYFMEYWNSLPIFLESHGYQVEILQLPWSQRRERRRQAEALIRQRGHHLIVDEATAEEFADLFRDSPPRTLFIPEVHGRARGLQGLAFLLHRCWLTAADPRLPVPRAASLGLDPERTRQLQLLLLEVLRRRAEADWTTDAGNEEFSLETDATPC